MKNNLKIKEAIQGNWRTHGKISDTFRKAAIAIVAVVLLMVVLTGCITTGDLATFHCDSPEEVQKVLPDYYYFDLGDDTTFSRATLRSSQTRKRPRWEKSIYDYSYYSYSITYTMHSETSQIGIGIVSNKFRTYDTAGNWLSDDYTTLKRSIQIIDSLECKFYYLYKENNIPDGSEFVEKTYSFYLFFELEKILYSIALFESFHPETHPFEEDMQRMNPEQFLSIAENAIVNRHKGG